MKKLEQSFVEGLTCGENMPLDAIAIRRQALIPASAAKVRIYYGRFRKVIDAGISTLNFIN